MHLHHQEPPVEENSENLFLPSTTALKVYEQKLTLFDKAPVIGYNG